MQGAPRRERGVTGAGTNAAPWMMYAEAGCTEAGRRGYSSTEVGSRRASRCGRGRTARTWMGWITCCGVHRGGSLRAACGLFAISEGEYGATAVRRQGGATSKRADVLVRERFRRLFCWGLVVEFFLPESAHRPGAGTVGALWLWGDGECEDVKGVGGWGYCSFGAGRLVRGVIEPRERTGISDV
jgi:hypothetical protein